MGRQSHQNGLQQQAHHRQHDEHVDVYGADDSSNPSPGYYDYGHGHIDSGSAHGENNMWS